MVGRSGIGEGRGRRKERELLRHKERRMRIERAADQAARGARERKMRGRSNRGTEGSTQLRCPGICVSLGPECASPPQCTNVRPAACSPHPPASPVGNA